MKIRRSNLAFLISLTVHLLGALILISVHTQENSRRGTSSVAVEFNVKTPPPKLEQRRPKFELEKFDPEQRTTNTSHSVRLPELTTALNLMKADVSREVVVLRGGPQSPPGLKMPEDTRTGDMFSDGSKRARGAGRILKGVRTQLIDFVDRSKGRRDIIYCLDVSASMGTTNKLGMARNYLKDSLIALNEHDTFNIITFSKDTRIFRSGGLISSTRENVMDAITFLDEYNSQNTKTNIKTDLLSALIHALEMKPSIIVAVTDGLPTIGVVQPEKIIQTVRERNARNTKIFAIGMEMDSEQPEAWLMKAIAEQNNGEFQFF